METKKLDQYKIKGGAHPVRTLNSIRGDLLAQLPIVDLFEQKPMYLVAKLVPTKFIERSGQIHAGSFLNEYLNKQFEQEEVESNGIIIPKRVFEKSLYDLKNRIENQAFEVTREKEDIILSTPGLTDNRIEALIHCYGLRGEKPLTHKEYATKLGTTASWPGTLVRQATGYIPHKNPLLSKDNAAKTLYATNQELKNIIKNKE